MAAGHLVPAELRCESLSEPLAIDRQRPSLSWKVRAATPGLKGLSQSAYRVLVASDKALLASEKGDLWDSGRVQSSETFGIEYSGRKLKSGEDCWWAVQSWDQAGVASEWSAPARFRIGLLSPADWKAQWIAIDAPERMSGDGEKFVGASWIWSGADTQGKVPKVTRSFSRTFSVDPASLQSAILNLTVDDQFVLFVNGKEVGKSDGGLDSWRRPISLDLKPFLLASNEIRIDATNDGESAAGVLGRLVLRSTSGAETVIVTDSTWTEKEKGPATVIGSFGSAPWGSFGARLLRSASYYRKEFTVRRKLSRATAYVTALGLVDLHLNGRRVSDDLFTPGWTDYEKRIHYRAYDITASLREGPNAVGAVLGDGWYSGYIGYAGERAHYGERPRVLVQVDLEYEDGSREVVATSADWKAAAGPTTEQDFLMGESFDARLDFPGWSSAGFSDASWQKPYLGEKPKGELEAFPAPPVRPYAELPPKTVKEVKPGVYIVDFGQNLAGFARLKVRGKSGQKVTLRFGEWLNPDGTLYTANLRSARQEDSYICRGDGEEVWEPRFTFHGFQYVEVTGTDLFPLNPSKTNHLEAGEFGLTAIAISSATPEVGSIETSDEMLNRLAKNAWWTQKMNFIDVPTDCPQRDERLGWTGDAQAYIHTANMYSDNQAFYAKWLVSLDDAQRADGQFPMVAPLKVAGDDGGPAWADAGVICPWTVYEMYGDERQLAEHYPAMKRFVEFCHKRSTPDLLPPAQFHCFGDWLSIRADTPHDVIYQAYFAGSARLLARAASALGKADEAQEYGKLADKVAASFRRAFVTPEGVIKGDTQCGYVLALAFDLLEPAQVVQASARLVGDIEKRGWHLSTGFVGTRDLMHVLSKIGRDDVAFRLLHQTTFPSWKFEIVNGATTIWERWDGWTPEKGLQDPGMNSFAHYAYGAVMGWVFAQIGGLSEYSPGFGKVVIAPKIDPNLTFAESRFDSVRGEFLTDWKVAGGKLTLSVTVPPNASATVRVPVSAGGTVVGELEPGSKSAGFWSYSLGSGTHSFVSDWR